MNPHLNGRTYSTLVYVPVQSVPGWKEQDASNEVRWYFTGGTGTDTGCNEVTYCTLADAKAAAPAATILTVQLNKGRDWAFTGAVDELRDQRLDLRLRAHRRRGSPGYVGGTHWIVHPHRHDRSRKNRSCAPRDWVVMPMRTQGAKLLDRAAHLLLAAMPLVCRTQRNAVLTDRLFRAEAFRTSPTRRRCGPVYRPAPRCPSASGGGRKPCWMATGRRRTRVAHCCDPASQRQRPAWNSSQL